jgi:hypothetical protein
VILYYIEFGKIGVGRLAGGPTTRERRRRQRSEPSGKIMFTCLILDSRMWGYGD